MKGNKSMLTIELETTLISTKNHRRIFRAGGRLIVAKSQLAKEQEQELEVLLLMNKPKWVEMIKNTDKEPLRVCFLMLRPNKKRSDWMNLLQGLADMMTKMEYIKDDCWQYFLPICCGCGVDKLHPRVIMWIYQPNIPLEDQITEALGGKGL